MSQIPEDLKYTTSHEWVRVLSDGTVQVGISDHAQDALGDMVFVEVPEAGGAYPARAECAVVESVKAASDLYCPLSGEVVEVNPALEREPEIINRDPYGEGWIFRLRPDNPADLERLLDADEYAAILAEEK
ncbi:MAG: glycine cleavage system protein GcvH [Pseudomonadota bacterium]|nr:glycine cleavage system protein GcvH [Gammaproteobacteria bacterium]MDQ3580344.1 glycine cleavage system protein GcvH [Pseudomonadota bacterium]